MPSELALRRLASQHLLGPPHPDPGAVVRWSGAVQAQDYPAAKWAVAQRTESYDDAGLDAAVNEGAILRTHMLRPTWHFVAPSDLRWIQALTAPRVHVANRSIYRQTELDDRLLERTDHLLAGWLAGGTFLTRPEVADRLGEAGIAASGIRLAYILMHAELEAVICNGPLRGRQHTYALLDERAPKTTPRAREEALAELAVRYFTSHGPAQLQDFAWWSGLTLRDVRDGADLAGSQLSSEILDGKTYWCGRSIEKPSSGLPSAHLLPNYDEYFIALRDRSAFFNSSRATVGEAPQGFSIATSLSPPATSSAAGGAPSNPARSPLGPASSADWTRQRRKRWRRLLCGTGAFSAVPRSCSPREERWGGPVGVVVTRSPRRKDYSVFCEKFCGFSY